MYEKLSTEGQDVGVSEYDVQTGFGWTNGAILDLLVRYKDTIKYSGGKITQHVNPTKSKPKGTKEPNSFQNKGKMINFNLT
jgi:hypothetical protein